jgi:uncharacterized membrane protein YgcG
MRKPLGARIAAFLIVAAALSVPPPPDRRVNDYAGALTPADRDRLEQQLAARETTSRNQVVVGVFRSLEGESLEGYSIRLAKAWRIGQKGLDNGVIFLVFLDDRKMRIARTASRRASTRSTARSPAPTRARRRRTRGTARACSCCSWRSWCSWCSG